MVALWCRLCASTDCLSARLEAGRSCMLRVYEGTLRSLCSCHDGRMSPAKQTYMLHVTCMQCLTSCCHATCRIQRFGIIRGQQSTQPAAAAQPACADHQPRQYGCPTGEPAAAHSPDQWLMLSVAQPALARAVTARRLPRSYLAVMLLVVSAQCSTAYMVLDSKLNGPL